MGLIIYTVYRPIANICLYWGGGGSTITSVSIVYNTLNQALTAGGQAF
jgi:hypothetical protein